jgi:hypothetical protein
MVRVCPTKERTVNDVKKDDWIDAIIYAFNAGMKCDVHSSIGVHPVVGMKREGGTLSHLGDQLLVSRKMTSGAVVGNRFKMNPDGSIVGVMKKELALVSRAVKKPVWPAPGFVRRKDIAGIAAFAPPPAPLAPTVAPRRVLSAAGLGVVANPDDRLGKMKWGV